MTTEVTTKHAALTARDEAVTGWNTAEKALRAAQRAERDAPKPSAARTIARKARLSAGALKANRKVEIRQAELDIRLAVAAGATIAYEPWVEPEAPADLMTTHLLPMTQAEIEGKLAAIRGLRKTLKPDTEASVIHDCDVRIKGLLKSAEQRGYKVS